MIGLHGLRTRVEGLPGSSPFDFDVIRSPRRRLEAVRVVTHDIPAAECVSANPPLTPLPATLASSGMVKAMTGYWTYRGMKANRVIVDGLHTLPPEVLARQKMRRGDPGDVFGILQAHVGAYHERAEVAGNRIWQQCVRKAIGLCGHALELTPKPPQWVPELIETGFRHPAFDDIIEQPIR